MRTLRLQSLAIFHKRHLSQSHLGASWLLSCTKILLKVCTRPAAIALNYSVKDIRNDVRQIIIIIFDEKSRFNSLVWGSLTLAQLSLPSYFPKGPSILFYVPNPCILGTRPVLPCKNGSCCMLELVGTKSVLVLRYSWYLSAVSSSQVELSFQY